MLVMPGLMLRGIVMVIDLLSHSRLQGSNRTSVPHGPATIEVGARGTTALIRMSQC